MITISNVNREISEKILTNRMEGATILLLSKEREFGKISYRIKRSEA